MQKPLIKPRNNVLFDNWSLVHLFFGILLGWAMPPLVAIVILILWEPLEIFVFSPILRMLGITFGHETLRNSLSDIVVDIIGVGIGLLVLGNLVEPPFILLG